MLCRLNCHYQIYHSVPTIKYQEDRIIRIANLGGKKHSTNPCLLSSAIFARSILIRNLASVHWGDVSNLFIVFTGMLVKPRVTIVVDRPWEDVLLVDLDSGKWTMVLGERMKVVTHLCRHKLKNRWILKVFGA